MYLAVSRADKYADSKNKGREANSLFRAKRKTAKYSADRLLVQRAYTPRHDALHVGVYRVSRAVVHNAGRLQAPPV